MKPRTSRNLLNGLRRRAGRMTLARLFGCDEDGEEDITEDQPPRRRRSHLEVKGGVSGDPFRVPPPGTRAYKLWMDKDLQAQIRTALKEVAVSAERAWLAERMATAKGRKFIAKLDKKIKAREAKKATAPQSPFL